MSNQNPSYDEFARRRDRLEAILTTLAAAFRRLESEERAGSLEKARETLVSDTFKVLVVGEFKRGKSTLINSLLGQSILPARVSPCTAVLTRIRYSERKEARLFYRDGRHPLTISLEESPGELRKYITLDPDEDDDDPSSTPSNPYSSAEVGYPLALCRNHVEIVDSPGLNEHQARTEITRSYYAETDAMVVVLSCEQAYSQTEQQFIEQDLQGRELGDTFFLWNRYDAIRDSPEDAEHVRRISRRQLEGRVGRPDRVFWVSGSEALRGRKEHQPALLERSNVPRFEAALEEFLAKERGRVKLRNPLREAGRAVREGMLELIPHRENLFRQPLEEVRRKLEVERPRLDEAERQEERLMRAVDRRREALVREVEASYRNLAMELENGLRAEAEQIRPTVFQTIVSRKKVKEEIANHLAGWMSERFRSWERDTLRFLLEAHLEELQEDLDDRASEFLTNLDRVKAAFAPGGSERPSSEVSALDRLIGGGLGFFAGGIGSAVEGATMGPKHMVRGLAANFALAIGMAALGFGLSAIGPALAILGLYRVFTGARHQADELREGVVRELSARLRAQQTGAEKELEEQISARFGEIRDRLGARMSLLVDEVRGQVQKVIREREQHQGAATAQLAVLTEVRATLLAQSQLLDELDKELET